MFPNIEAYFCQRDIALHIASRRIFIAAIAEGAYFLIMKEEEIRPQEIFSKYLELSRLDGQALLKGELVEIPCPACSTSLKNHFNKFGYEYKTCPTCLSLIQSPRPSGRDLDEFYKKSESSFFWSNTFFPRVAESRREKIFRPRVNQLTEFLGDSLHNISTVMDVGAGYGIFLEEWKKAHPSHKVVAVEPGEELAHNCRQKGFETIESTAENASKSGLRADLVTCFESMPLTP